MPVCCPSELLHHPSLCMCKGFSLQPPGIRQTPRKGFAKYLERSQGQSSSSWAVSKIHNNTGEPLLETPDLEKQKPPRQESIKTLAGNPRPSGPFFSPATPVTSKPLGLSELWCLHQRENLIHPQDLRELPCSRCAGLGMRGQVHLSVAPGQLHNSPGLA